MNAAIGLALISIYVVLVREPEPMALLPASVFIVGGVAGAGAYVVKTDPLARHLQLAALVSVVLGAVTAIATRNLGG